MPEWLHRHLPEGWSTTHLVTVTVALTIGTMLISLFMVAIVIVQIPFDYFVGNKPSQRWADRKPFLRWPLLLLKNLLGILLILLGILLSLPGVPGQGLLTILIGLMLMNFPGKRRLEQWLIRRRGVLPGMNRLRARFNRPPLLLDSSPPST
jgi:hypothetical protein